MLWRWMKGGFFSSVKIRDVRGGDFCWEIINVYGPVKTELKGLCLQELYRKTKNTEVPIMVGGDFNMTRFVQEKRNGP
jgi:hypothetical protein